MSNRNKGDLQSDVLFSNGMDELLRSTERMSGVVRNSMNPNANLNLGSQLNIKKSIRGGAGR